jgi:hypothetical protein
VPRLRWLLSSNFSLSRIYRGDFRRDVRTQVVVVIATPARSKLSRAAQRRRQEPDGNASMRAHTGTATGADEATLHRRWLTKNIKGLFGIFRRAVMGGLAVATISSAPRL